MASRVDFILLLNYAYDIKVKRHLKIHFQWYFNLITLFVKKGGICEPFKYKLTKTALETLLKKRAFQAYQNMFLSEKEKLKNKNSNFYDVCSLNHK